MSFRIQLLDKFKMRQRDLLEYFGNSNRNQEIESLEQQRELQISQKVTAVIDVNEIRQRGHTNLSEIWPT